ncbi:MAG TPA: hypothetical protein VGR52_03015 [Stellaceae bacterium]|nr:hypothetical protein [Stellaceae bacterium]
MTTLLLVSFLSVVSFLWLGPWAAFFMGGRVFLVALGILALLVGWNGWWWYLVPLCFAYVGATIAAHWLLKYPWGQPRA